MWLQGQVRKQSLTWSLVELIWLDQLLQELRCKVDGPMKVICGNQAAVHITTNQMFHERTKLERGCHFVR